MYSNIGLSIEAQMHSGETTTHVERYVRYRTRITRCSDNQHVRQYRRKENADGEEISYKK
jgi:hypothetical protein